ncbi:MAG TPA: HEAT repeat domain-containing protein, partial [bacterium]
PLVGIGESFPKNKILASVVKASEFVPQLPTVDKDFYIELLKSPSIPDRYTGAKALSFVESKYTTDVLTKKLGDDSEHIYVKLEAAATLARLNNPSGIEFIKNILNSSYLEHRLESIIILGEIKNNISCDVLRSVLNDPSQNPEIRSGAAWALGELNNKSCLNDLIDAFSNINTNIQIEATRALARLCDKFTPEILAEFSRSEKSQRPGIAWALSKTNKWSIEEVLKHTPLNDIDARQWTSYILGMSEQDKVIENIEKIKQYDQEIYFATTLLWKIISSWIYNLEEY